MRDENARYADARADGFGYAYTYGKPIEELQIPLGIVACDLQTGEKLVFTKGSVSEAVRASISIPGVFVDSVDHRAVD